jgi:hypothetical protein
MILAAFVTHAIWRSRPTVFTHIAHVSDEKVFAELSEFIFASLRPDGPATAHPSAHHAPRSRS